MCVWCVCVCVRNFWPFTQEKKALEVKSAELEKKIVEVQGARDDSEVCWCCVCVRVCVRA